MVWKRWPGVSRVVPATRGGPVPTQAADGVLALTVAQIPLQEGGTEALSKIRQYVRGVQSEALSIRVTGGQAIADDFTEFAETDTKRSEFTALPLIAGLLLLVFGALVATGLPLAVGVLSISVAMAALYGLTFLMPVSTFAQSVITMLGLGAGIDYALLMVNRFREELRHEPDPRAAAARTVMTAGRSVAFSGSTVGIAMAGLILPPVAFVRSIGIGGVLAVILTVLASLTALPALLALLGERVNSPRLLKVTWAQSGAASVAWTAFARRVTARPVLGVVLSTALLLTLAVPALGLKTGYAGAWGLVPGVPSRDALSDVRELGAGGLLSQFEVILDLGGQRYTPADRNRFQKAVNDLRALPGVKAVISPFLTPADLAGAGSGRAGGPERPDPPLLQRGPRAAARDGGARRYPARPGHRRVRGPCARHSGRQRLRVPAGRRARGGRGIQPRDHRHAAGGHRGGLHRHLPAADGGLPQPADSR